MVILVMAQGRGTRWMGNPRVGIPEAPALYKHMLPLPPDRTLAGRTADVLLSTFPGCDLIFIGPASYLGAYRHQRLHQVLLGAPGTYHTDALVEAERLGLWPRGEDLLYVLGDVLLSRRSAERWRGGIEHAPDSPVLLCRRLPNIVTGKNASENFGLYVPARLRRRLMEKVTAWAVQPRSRPPKPWPLPILARPQLEGRVDVRRGLAQWPEPLGVETDDYTDDVDSVEEYAAFWMPMLRGALEEDGVRPPRWLEAAPTPRAGLSGADASAGDDRPPAAVHTPDTDEAAPWESRDASRRRRAMRERLAAAAGRDGQRAWLSEEAEATEDG